MSGAQPKAARIAGVVGVVAEIDPAATAKRYEQGWVDEVYEDLEALATRIRTAKRPEKPYRWPITAMWWICGNTWPLLTYR